MTGILANLLTEVKTQSANAGNIGKHIDIININLGCSANHSNIDHIIDKICQYIDAI